jgi:hypothetical protein
MTLAARLAKENLARQKKDDTRRELANEKAEKLRIVEEARIKVRPCACTCVCIHTSCILCPAS